MSRGGDRGGRRPRTHPQLKREVLHDFRLPHWMIQWLKRHGRYSSRMVERAILAQFQLTPPHIGIGNDHAETESVPPENDA